MELEISITGLLNKPSQEEEVVGIASQPCVHVCVVR